MTKLLHLINNHHKELSLKLSLSFSMDGTRTFLEYLGNIEGDSLKRQLSSMIVRLRFHIFIYTITVRISLVIFNNFCMIFSIISRRFHFDAFIL